MPKVPTDELVSAIINAILESAYTGQLISPAAANPRRFLVSSPTGETLRIWAYIWTLTPGGRKNLPREFRIQLTGVKSPLQIAEEGPTALLGYDPDLHLFAGFDLERHREFTPGSSSVQIDRTELAKAEADGLSFDRKNNDEIAIGIRPDMLMPYCLNAPQLHRFGREAAVLRLLNKAARLETPEADEIQPLSTPRQRVVQEVSRLTRLASFRQQVLFAYGQRCAVTRVQLRLVDAAHILPVGAEGSADHVRNGIALSPTYHRAFDAGLIFLDEENRMRVNERQLQELRRLDLGLGIETFRAPLGRRIFLPPDPNQRPSAELIRLANRFRRVNN